MMTPKGDAQSAETFRVVGTDATDGCSPRFCESNSGLRLARCPLSFLGRLKPFFSFWQRKKRMGSKKRSFGRGRNRKKRADRVVRPYGCRGRSEVARIHCNCSPTLIRLLRRHLPRRGRQSAAAGMGRQGRPPLRVRRRTQGCTVSVGCCLTAIIKIACGAGRTAKNQSATQRSGCGLERKKEQADTELSASAGSAVQRASSDAAAILFFLRKEAKRMVSLAFFAKIRYDG